MATDAVPVHAAIETYNRYRRPTAVATLLDRDDDTFTVRFTGHFATTCCRDDYFEDLAYEFPEHGVPADRIGVTAIQQRGPETFDVAFSVAPPGPEHQR